VADELHSTLDFCRQTRAGSNNCGQVEGRTASWQSPVGEVKENYIKNVQNYDIKFIREMKTSISSQY
jgi:hypothetical protein